MSSGPSVFQRSKIKIEFDKMFFKETSKSDIVVGDVYSILIIP
ncbi:MAG: hypothetical protein V3V33_15600 [Candidatus Lokiarchaeia archaeon]